MRAAQAAARSLKPECSDTMAHASKLCSSQSCSVRGCNGITEFVGSFAFWLWPSGAQGHELPSASSDHGKQHNWSHAHCSTMTAHTSELKSSLHRKFEQARPDICCFQLCIKTASLTLIPSFISASTLSWMLRTPHLQDWVGASVLIGCPAALSILIRQDDVDAVLQAVL